MRVQDIIQEVKKERGRLGKGERGPIKLISRCMHAENIARNFGGSGWRSETAIKPPEARYPGHSLGVIPTRGEYGAVVDFTEEQPIIGIVSDIGNNKKVAEQLKEITGFPGWYPRLTEPHCLRK